MGRLGGCGRTEPRYPREALTVGRPIVCQEKDRDRFGRTVAICRVSGEDLGAILVREGFAWAFTRYSVDYVDQQERPAPPTVAYTPMTAFRVGMAGATAYEAIRAPDLSAGLTSGPKPIRWGNRKLRRLLAFLLDEI